MSEISSCYLFEVLGILRCFFHGVFQALTVLEYLVANGADRVIDELREHTYQIQV